MKTIIKIWVFLSFYIANAQEHLKFYVEIPNSTAIPIISNKYNGSLNLSFQNTELNTLFSNYTIYKFEKAFPIARNPKLQTFYLIECNSIGLKISIDKSYSNYFPYTELVQEAKLLYTPNDYIHSGDILYNAKNLDLINVKDAWDYSKGNPSFLIGISDTPINSNHEDLIGKVTTLYPSNAGDSHGTASASTTAASTDNGKGIAGVGFNSSILGAYTGVYQLLQLSNNGARVVNASWYNGCNDDGSFSLTNTDQLLLNEIHENGTVIVVAAGNGVETGYGPGSTPCANPEKFFFPASYNHVISVSGVGSQDVGYIYPLTGEARDWRDRVEKIPGNPYYRTQTNTDVDLRAPAHGNWAAVVPTTANGNAQYFRFGGTSSAAPHVAGGVSLMLTANSCLNPDEVESLLKLTSVKLDSISTNIPYIGKLGAGRMDIGNATKAAWQMNPANGGEVLLKNRTFNKWHFEILNSPEYIRLKNEEFIENSDIVFRARKGITLDVNTILEPGSGKSHYLYVENINTCFNFTKTLNPANIQSKNSRQNTTNTTESINDTNFEVKITPNPSKDFVKIIANTKILDIAVYDSSGKIINTEFSDNILDIRNLPNGIYILKIQSKSGAKSIKFIKN